MFGVPVTLIYTARAIFWQWKNSGLIYGFKKDEFKNIERKVIKLDTNINYDYYESDNKKGKTVLFLHGYPDSAASWRYTMSALSKEGFHCLAPNQRGYGKSSKPADGLYHINFLVADIASFVKQKANNKKVILVIHDWGSAVGFEFTRQHPELVEKIVGINSPSLPGMRIQWKTNPAQLIASFYIFVNQLPWFPEFCWSTCDYALTKFILCSIGTRKSDVQEAIENFGVYEDPNVLHCAINWYRENGGASEINYERVFNEKPKMIEQDVLILWGEKDPALTVKCIDIEQSLISGKFKAVRYPEGNHNLFHEFREEVISEILPFITEK